MGEKSGDHVEKAAGSGINTQGGDGVRTYHSWTGKGGESLQGEKVDTQATAANCFTGQNNGGNSLCS